MSYISPLPPRIDSEELLDDFMSAPSPDLVRDLEMLDGDILILGVGGRREEDGPAVGIITPQRIARHLAEGVRARPTRADPVTAVGPPGPLDTGGQRGS